MRFRVFRDLNPNTRMEEILSGSIEVKYWTFILMGDNEDIFILTSDENSINPNLDLSKILNRGNIIEKNEKILRSFIKTKMSNNSSELIIKPKEANRWIVTNVVESESYLLGEFEELDCISI